ncbi:TetR/AcrR family transcriptional regulator [Streptomyces sp. SBT349]|uniref:TetR/AcrR family transcriptional regulator n=1 Tax=Streptomyces sp. SBT349 TaxID=1580539 RepID=UPI00066B3B86|nr:TetR/AcrR family transcriptional regulator [Streptomyces sp. SBT349]
MTEPTREPGLRKAPQQARSRARVEAILAAADRLLAREGVEALTTRRIAADAAVPVGTLYQFFDDRDAVLAAVARQHMETHSAAMRSILRDARDARWYDLVNLVFDRYVELYRKNPGYLAIRTGRYLSRELLQLDEDNNAMVAAHLRRILVSREHLADSTALAVACRAGVHASEALLQLAFRDHPDGDRTILAEARRIQHLYLADIVADPRYRDPARPRHPD